MMQSQTLPRFTVAEYLAWEMARPDRHEYIDGRLLEKACVEDRHATVAGNLAVALREHLRTGPCRIDAASVRLFVPSSNAYFYPDLMVTCDPSDAANRLVKSAPLLVVEVLSPSTGAYDRGDKFAHYRGIASLQEYVLVDIDRRATDVYRKGDDGLWVLHPFAGEQAVELASVALTVAAAELFADLEGESPTESATQ